MKKFLILITLFIAFAAGLVYLNKEYLLKNSTTSNLRPPSSEAELNENDKNFEPGNEGLKAVWLKVESLNKLTLYNNLEEKLKSADAMTKNQCASLVSAYFYDDQMNPLGLVVIDGNSIKGPSKKSLLNGFFSVSQDNKVKISSIVPENAKIAVQSGPLLMIDSKVKDVSSETDEKARRIVAATDANDEIYFFVIFDQRNLIRGPNLEDLPGLISEIGSQNQLNLKNAINLDGGAHSAFVTEFTNLGELSTIGGYFCLKP